MSQSKTKQKAKERDGHECQFCGVTQEQHTEEFGRGLEAHHIIKGRIGGPDSRRNYVTVCRDCHGTIEQTQARGFEVLKSQQAEEMDDAISQRDALLERVEYLERLIRTGEVFGLVTGSRVSAEVVAERFGTDTTVTTDSNKAREEYDDWGSLIKRASVRVTDSDVKEWSEKATYRGDVNNLLSEGLRQ